VGAAAAVVRLMAELLLSRMDTSRRGAPVLFGRGGGKPAAAGTAASLFVRAVGQDDPSGAAAGAATGGTGVRTMVLVVSLFASYDEIDGGERGRCLRGRHLRREVWSSLRRCRAHLYTFLRIMTANDCRGDSSEEEDFLKGSIALYKGTDTKK
jgi:hypothetical protein